jgi:hypothetical protein
MPALQPLPCSDLRSAMPSAVPQTRSAPLMQTTLMLPDDLLAAVDDAVREGQASSRDELIVEAIRRWFASVDGEAIDLAFASMADGEE